jgi:hypothetical protein
MGVGTVVPHRADEHHPYGVSIRERSGRRIRSHGRASLDPHKPARDKQEPAESGPVQPLRRMVVKDSNDGTA